MRTEIHPEYADTSVTCSCGNTFVTRSTKPGSMHVELCNECHPFFTGRQKLVDTGGRVERFQKRYAGAEIKSKKRQKAETSPAEGDAAEETVEVE
jgi:large subunit ribosomal protein L31